MSVDFGAEKDQVAVDIYFACSAACICLNSYAIVVISRNKRINRAVKTFFLGNHTTRIVYSICGLYFAECSNNLVFCVTDPLYYLFFHPISLFSTSCVYIAILCQFLLTVNRFFSVSFEGRFYSNVIKYPILQAALILLLPTVPLNLEWFLGSAHERTLYWPPNYQVVRIGDYPRELYEVLTYASLILILVATILDSMTIYKIKTYFRDKPFSRPHDLKISIQMCACNVATFIHLILELNYTEIAYFLNATVFYRLFVSNTLSTSKGFLLQNVGLPYMYHAYFAILSILFLMPKRVKATPRVSIQITGSFLRL